MHLRRDFSLNKISVTISFVFKIGKKKKYLHFHTIRYLCLYYCRLSIVWKILFILPFHSISHSESSIKIFSNATSTRNPSSGSNINFMNRVDFFVFISFLHSRICHTKKSTLNHLSHWPISYNYCNWSHHRFDEASTTETIGKCIVQCVYLREILFSYHISIIFFFHCYGVGQRRRVGGICFHK